MRGKVILSAFLTLCLSLTLFGGQAFGGIKVKGSGSDNFNLMWIHSGGTSFESITSVTVSTAKRKCFHFTANATQEPLGKEGCAWGLALDDPTIPWTQRYSNMTSNDGHLRRTVTVSSARKIPPGKHTIYFVGTGGSACALIHYYLTAIGPMGGNCPQPEQPAP